MTSETDLDAIAADLAAVAKMTEKVRNAVEALQWLRKPGQTHFIQVNALYPRTHHDLDARFMSGPIAGYIARAGEKFAAQIIEAARAEAQSVVDEYMHDGEAT